MVAHFDLSNVKEFVGNERKTIPANKDNDALWAKIRRSLLLKFPSLKLPQHWEIDIETWEKFRKLVPSSINNSELKAILIQQGYIGLTPQTIAANWGDDLTVPRCQVGAAWTHIRVIFYRDIFGAWQTYGDKKPFVRLRLPKEESTSAKYLSPKSSGTHLFWPYGLGQYAHGCEPCKLFGHSKDGDELDYAPRGNWLLVEGEDKAMIATCHGYPSVGLGGVEMWKKHKGGPLHPWLFALALRADSLTVVFDSDAFRKPTVVDAQRRLCREFFNHLVELAKVSDSEGDPAGYCEEVWGKPDDNPPIDTHYGSGVGNVRLNYAYLPPNPYAKGIDDILAVAEGRWLNDLLTEAPAAFEIHVEESGESEKGKKDKPSGNTVKAKFLFTEPSKLGLVPYRLNAVQNNAIVLARSALSAGWLQLNYWRPIGQRNTGMLYSWDEETKTWGLAPVKNAASFALNQWSTLAPSRNTLDGVKAKVDAETAQFTQVAPNLGKDGHRYMGLENGDWDIKNGLLRKIHPDHGCFSRLSIAPFEGKPLKFIDFYAERMTGGEADVERFFSFLALCFREPGKVHALGWVTGKAGRGKSSLMSLLGELLKGWVIADNLRNIFDANNANRGYLPMHLLGKSLVYDDDWKGAMTTSMVQSMNTLASNAEMAFRSMGKDPVTCKPDMGLLIISNQEPVIASNDIEGLPRRFQKWEFVDKPFTRADYELASAIVKEESGQILWYLLNKNIEDCVADLERFTEAEQQTIEREFAVNHSADWIDALQVWVEESLATLPQGQFKATSSHKVVSLNVAGSTLAVGPMAKDLEGSSEGGPSFNYLPESMAVRVEGGAIRLTATSANWVRAIGNYEREEHNPHATARGDRTTLKTLKTYADNLPSVTVHAKAEAHLNGSRIRGWAIEFTLPQPCQS